jgi:lauroyl/myristoyl acyltransferase
MFEREDRPMSDMLFSLWGTEKVQPLYELLQAMEPDQAYALMRDLHAAERRVLMGPRHAELADWVRPRIALAPRIAEHYDIDVLADQFADYVFELNVDSAFIIMLIAQPEKLAQVVDMGNVEVLAEAVASGRKILLTPLHFGPVYASLGVLARQFPITTMYHKIELEKLRDQLVPGLDLEGVQIGRGAMLQCLDALRAGRVLSIFPEYDPHGAGRAHVPLPFLGTTVAATTGPALIAQRTGALMVPFVFSSPSPGRFKFHFEPVIDPGEGEAARIAVTERLFGYLEETVLAGEPGKWELWADFERMADMEWLEARRGVAA